jgi:hypothetical protein
MAHISTQVRPETAPKLLSHACSRFHPVERTKLVFTYVSSEKGEVNEAAVTWCQANPRYLNLEEARFSNACRMRMESLVCLRNWQMAEILGYR